MVAGLWYFGLDPDFSYATTAFSLSNIYRSINTLLLITLVLSIYLDDNESRQHTVKHSIAFGISRKTVYLGRLITQVITCTVVYLFMNLLLMALSFALLHHSNAGETGYLMRALGAGLPLLLAALSISHCCIMNTQSPVSAATACLLILLLLPKAMNLLAKRVAFFSRAAYWHPYNLATPDVDSSGSLLLSWDSNTGMGNCYIAGLVWMLLFIILGTIIYRNKEIK